ncbi:MAG TPA: glycerate kinase [Jatrophihabitantaceae bacterium]|jgi:glycerate kinase
MRVIVAPDKFKGSLTAPQAADAMRLGVLDADPTAQVSCVPVADGGEGTVDAYVSAGATPHECTVTGPLGDPVSARFAIRDGIAVVETAQACGLALVEHPGPRTALAADTGGVAQLVLAAVAAGARRVVLGLGGSASTDGGSGLARGLGALLLDGGGRPLPPGGGALVDLDRIDPSGPARLDVEVQAACDVTAPLLDAAQVFAAQKGAGPDEIARLAAGLRRWAHVVERDVGPQIADVAGGGAAGGLGAGAIAFLDATVVSGVDVVLDLLEFADAVRDADLVITGEGSFDPQSLTGKAPMGVARAARPTPVWLIAGRATATAPELAGILALTDIADARTAIRDAAPLLRRRAADAVNEFSRGWRGTAGS